MTALLPLPGAGRQTAEYGIPRKPYTRPLPDLDSATDDEARDLAYNILQSDADLYAVCGSGQHVALIAKQVEKLELAETAALEAAATAQVLAACFARAYREEHLRAERLQAIVDANVALHAAAASSAKVSAAMDRCCQIVTGCASEELHARWRAEDAAELEALERGQRRADRAVYSTSEQLRAVGR